MPGINQPKGLENINFDAVQMTKQACYQLIQCYTLKQEFQRYFDTGYVRAQNPEVQKRVGNAENRGAGLVKALLIRVLKENPGLIPYAIIQSGAKWQGYRAGYHSHWMPLSLKIKLSSQRYYWVSKYHN